jgi:pyrroline-5-carboxylate reductase
MGVIPYITSERVSSMPGADKAIMDFLSPLGRPSRMKKELEIDMATGLSGSAPAYFLLFAESLVDSGVHMGLSRKQSELMVAQTLLGTATMAMDHVLSNKPGGGLVDFRNNVVSPGGTTAAALATAEKHRFRYTVSEMVWAAYRRSLEISDSADPNVYGPGVYVPRQSGGEDRDL